MSETGLVYKQYRVGPSTELWGTPNVNFFVSDRTEIFFQDFSSDSEETASELSEKFEEMFLH